MPLDDFEIPSPQQLSKAITGKEVVKKEIISEGSIENRWANHDSEVFELKSILSESVPQNKFSDKLKAESVSVSKKEEVPPTPSEFLKPSSNAFSLEDLLESEDEGMDDASLTECVETLLKPTNMLNDMLNKLCR
jgi:hypothetical protein